MLNPTLILFSAQQTLEDRNLKVHSVEPIFRQNERVYRYPQEGYKDHYSLVIEMQFIVSDAAKYNVYQYWWPIPGLTLESNTGQYCFYVGDKMVPDKNRQHDKPGLASLNKYMHRNSAKRTYIVWN